MKKMKRLGPILLIGALLLSGCSGVDTAKAKLGIGYGDLEEIVEIEPSKPAEHPLLFRTITIPDNVFIGDIDVSRLTEPVALAKVLRETEDYIKTGQVTLTANGKKQELVLSKLDLKYDAEKAVREAFALRYDQNNPEITTATGEETGEESKKSKTVISLDKTFDRDVIEEMVEELDKDARIDPVDDTITVEDGEFKIKTGKPGKGIVEEELFEELSLAFDRLEVGEIEAPIGEIEQNRLTEEDIGRLTGVIGAAETYYNEGNVNRSHNVKRSTACLNNFVLMPGETLSFNALTDVGGYREALVINENNEDVMGLGGGICQTATTFFQASVRAGLTIVESNNHTQPSAYTQLAWDAMVSGWSDVKVRNDFDFPVIYRSSAQGGVDYFEVLGDTSKKNYAVELVQGEVSTVPMPIKEIDDPTVPPGEEVIEKYGNVGYRVATYIADESKGTYKLRDNYYHPRTQVVRVNKGGSIIDENIDKWLEEYLKQLEEQESPSVL